MSRVVLVVIASGVFGAFLTCALVAQSTTITGGVSWLVSNQDPSGLWGTTKETPFRDATVVVTVLDSLGADSTVIEQGLSAINSRTTTSTDYLARKIIANAFCSHGSVPTSLVDSLANMQNTDGGWAYQKWYRSNVLETALALRALKSASYSNMTKLGQGVSYLVSQQNIDDGWSFVGGDTSRVFYTTHAIIALAMLEGDFNVTTQIQNGVDWLKTQAHGDGGFGTGGVSNPYETGLALAGLLKGDDPSAPEITDGANYLESTQLPNGSWDNDAYSTAKAIYGLIGVIPQSKMLEIPLDNGWNLASWNVDPENDSTVVILSEVVSHLRVALGFVCGEGGKTFDPTIPFQFSTLTLTDYLNGYWLKMTDEDTLVVEGIPVPRETPISLCSSWNLVSYLPDKVDSTAHALGSVLEHVVVVLGFDGGGLTYDPSIPPQFNTLQLMKPGLGYWIKTTEEDVLIYPDHVVHPGGMVAVVAAKNGGQAGPSNVIPTREWIGIWGDDMRIDGKLIEEGTLVRATDKDGIVCGAFTVHSEGEFGLMAVYRDDPDTEADEGPEQGEEVILQFGDITIPQGIRWTEFGDVIDFGEVVTSSDGMSETLPTEYALLQNYPNPFNPVTHIHYELPRYSHVRLVIYNSRGQHVRELVNEYQAARRYTVEWDGKDASGNPVASGVYFYLIKAGEFASTKKMVLLK